MIKGKTYSQHYYSHSRLTKLNLSRREIVSIYRLKSSHTSLKESLYRFNIVDSPNCPTCNSSESPDHIFCQCPRFLQQRNKLITKGVSFFTTLPFPTQSILASNNGNLYELLVCTYLFVNLYILLVLIFSFNLVFFYYSFTVYDCVMPLHAYVEILFYYLMIMISIKLCIRLCLLSIILYFYCSNFANVQPSYNEFFFCDILFYKIFFLYIAIN